MPIKITTLNVNGLRSAERRGFRRWLRRARPDVLCLQEIRCDAESLPQALWRPRGWRVGWHPAQKKGYAGTAVWARSPEVRFTIGSGHPRGDAEGRAVCVHLPELDVWSLYMPSGSSGPVRQAWKFEFMAHAWEWLMGLRASGRPTLLCGDLNIAHRPIDLKNWRSNQKNSGFLPEERAYMDRLLAEGWRDLFRERYPERVAYSWWSNRGRAREKDVGWRLDYILATPGIRIIECAIEREAGLSDHAPVSAWIEVAADPAGQGARASGMASVADGPFRRLLRCAEDRWRHIKNISRARRSGLLSPATGRGGARLRRRGSRRQRAATAFCPTGAWTSCSMWIRAPASSAAASSAR